MRLRTRLAVLLSVSLLAAGSSALLVNLVVFEHAPYPTWRSYSEELLAELEVSREGVIAAVERDPEILFNSPGDTSSWNGVTVDEASRAVQERAIRRAVDRSRLLTTVSVVAVLAGSLVAAWLFGRRTLRSIRIITERAMNATAADPGDRIALAGPDDEIKELAVTFDEMLDRIGRAHRAQRLFASQVSHELRTPLSVTSSEVEMLLAEVDEPTVERRLQAIAESTRRADRLVNQLLVLSRTQTGDLERRTIAFDELVGDVLARTVEQPEWRNLCLDFDLGPASISGDSVLLDSMVRNLIENAGRHNRRGGWVRVEVRSAVDGTGAVLEVANSARPGKDTDPSPCPRTGLTIVSAVLDAHGGDLEWSRPDGHVMARATVPGDLAQPTPFYPSTIPTARRKATASSAVMAVETSSRMTITE